MKIKVNEGDIKEYSRISVIELNVNNIVQRGIKCEKTNGTYDIYVFESFSNDILIEQVVESLQECGYNDFTLYRPKLYNVVLETKENHDYI